MKASKGTSSKKFQLQRLITGVSFFKKMCVFVCVVFYKTSGEDSLKVTQLFYQKFHPLSGFFCNLWSVTVIGLSHSCREVA